MSKNADSPLILRAVGQETYVNVGGGNITAVSSSLTWSGKPGTRISFLGGDSCVLEGEPLEDVVKSLQNVGGFGR